MDDKTASSKTFELPDGTASGCAAAHQLGLAPPLDALAEPHQAVPRACQTGAATLTAPQAVDTAVVSHAEPKPGSPPSLTASDAPDVREEALEIGSPDSPPRLTESPVVDDDVPGEEALLPMRAEVGRGDVSGQRDDAGEKHVTTDILEVSRGQQAGAEEQDGVQGAFIYQQGEALPSQHVVSHSDTHDDVEDDAHMLVPTDTSAAVELHSQEREARTTAISSLTQRADNEDEKKPEDARKHEETKPASHQRARSKRTRGDEEADEEAVHHALTPTPTKCEVVAGELLSATSCAAHPLVKVGSHEDSLRLPDDATREQVGRLQRLLLSLFSAPVRAAYAPHYADADIKVETHGESMPESITAHSTGHTQPVGGDRAAEEDDADQEAVAARASQLVELLENVAEDKLFVHAAWRRCQDVHQLRRQKLSKRRHQAALSRLTGSSATQRRRQQQQQQQQQQHDEEGEDGPVRTAEDSPLDLFHFTDWDPQSCWRHLSRKSQANGRRGHVVSAANQSPFINAISQDREEYVEVVARQLGGEVVAPAVPVTLPMVLPAREEENYARYVLSSGKLRRECLEPFQYLSTRASVVREQLLAQYREALEDPEGA